MQSRAEISIVMPTYNSSEFLSECINSILKQTFSNFELIVVDDGSSDDTPDILYNYSLTDDRVRVYKQNHRFAGAARNFGAQKATGQYLLFLDSDDIFNENLLEHSLKQIKKTRADICVFGSAFLDNKTGKISNESTLHLDKCPNSEIFNRFTNPRYLFQFTSPAPWTKLLKRSFVLDNNLSFQETRSANDLSFTYTALAVANQITTLNEALVIYRRNNERSLQSSQKIKPFSFYYALIHLKEELETRKLYNSLKSTYSNAALGNCIYNLHTLRSFPDVQKEVFYFLQTEGLKKLDIANKPLKFFYGHSEKRMREFSCLESGTFAEFLNLNTKKNKKSELANFRLKRIFRNIIPLRSIEFKQKTKELHKEIDSLQAQINILIEENRNLSDIISACLNERRLF